MHTLQSFCVIIALFLSVIALVNQCNASSNEGRVGTVGDDEDEEWAIVEDEGEQPEDIMEEKARQTKTKGDSWDSKTIGLTTLGVIIVVYAVSQLYSRAMGQKGRKGPVVEDVRSARLARYQHQISEKIINTQNTNRQKANTNSAAANQREPNSPKSQLTSNLKKSPDSNFKSNTKSTNLKAEPEGHGSSDYKGNDSNQDEPIKEPTKRSSTESCPENVGDIIKRSSKNDIVADSKTRTWKDQSNTSCDTSTKEKIYSENTLQQTVTKIDKTVKTPLSREEVVLKTLSKTLKISVELETKEKSLSKLYLKRVPDKDSDLEPVVNDLFSKRLRREFKDKVRLCIEIYDACVSESTTEEVANAILEMVKIGSARAVLQQIQADSSSLEEDDFWSSVSDTQGKSETVMVKFLNRVGGWTSDGIALQSNLLKLILQEALYTEEGRVSLINIIKTAGLSLKKIKRLDEAMMEQSGMIQGLEKFLNQPQITKAVLPQLKAEIQESSETLGVYFETSSIFSGLLSISSVPRNSRDGLNPKADHAQCYITLPGFPNRVNRDDLDRVQDRIQGLLHKSQNMVFQVIQEILKHKALRRDVLVWLATVVNANELRTSANPLQETSLQAACSDGFMLNFTAVLLELCQPFCKGNLEMVGKIDHAYSTSKACLLNYEYETCLAGGQIVSESQGESEATPTKETMVSSAEPATQDQFNFMTEIFHITQRNLNVAVIPAIAHFQKLTSELASVISQKQGTEAATSLQAQQLLLTLRWDCSLMDPEFVRKVSEFYITQAQWLMLQLESCKQDSSGVSDINYVKKLQRLKFSQLPEYTVKDMATWFTFVAQQVLQIHPRVLQGLQLAPFIDCCVTLLRRPDLVPGPIPASKLVSVLLAFVSTSNRTSSSRSNTWGSGILTEFAAMVHTCPTVQNHLGPALLHTYISVNVVEGLDVDKDDFDKYRTRNDISRLLQNLWQRQDCRASVLKLCHTDTEKFQSFLGAILDTLLYMLHDSLARLENVRKLQRAKDDSESWEALSFQEKQHKEAFLRNEERVARGFMKLAVDTLGLATMFSKSEEVAKQFTIQPLAQRAANAMLGFIEKLCGTKAVELKVKDMDKYNFNPRQLLLEIVQLMVRILKEETGTNGFVGSLASDADYNKDAMLKALDVLNRQNLGDEELISDFETMLQQIDQIRLQSTTQSSQVPCQPLTWLENLPDIDQEELIKHYATNMRDEKYDTADLKECHSYSANAGDGLHPRSPKVKALMKEVRQLQSDLPIHPDAAIYVRQDEEHMDLVRAVITGPVDTPYSRGCFVFDIYCPSNYPNIPPLVNLITTGNSQVRFNPNLYADGKVCLSLLGTWHGGNASEKWNPGKSNLYQVLVSIQSMILIPEPMYNEPGYESIVGSTEGNAQSAQYNRRIRLFTIRHAMLGQLKNPPSGVDHVIKRHFRLQRDAILKQCCDWLSECQDAEEERRMRQTVNELKDLLYSLPDIENEDADCVDEDNE